jgi:hypothetical protein
MRFWLSVATDRLELASCCRIVCREQCRRNAVRWTPRSWHAAVEDRADCDSRRIAANSREIDMHQLIYLVGLIVVILAILSFFGLR